MSRKIKTSLLLASCGLAVIIIALVVELNRSPQKPTQTRPDIGGAFTLTNQNGKIVTQADFAGRPLVIYFGFTYCPDVCPLSLDILGEALAILEKDAPRKAKQLQPIFISVDPARDTPAQMKDYLSYFHPRLLGLTGTAEQIDAVKKAFRVYAAKARDTDPNGNYNVDHSSFFYLMDGNNRYIAHFSHTMSATELADGLKKKLP